MIRPNIITIERNVPVPTYNTGRGRGRIKYAFVDNMEVGDSFCINGSTPDYVPINIKAHMYKLNASIRDSKQYTIRTLEGSSKNPISIRIWRTQ